FDHDRLSPTLAELLAERARKGVGPPAGGLRHHQMHQPGGIVLRRGGRGRRNRGYECSGGGPAIDVHSSPRGSLVFGRFAQIVAPSARKARPKVPRVNPDANPGTLVWKSH